jgi:hypothetical protein
MLAAFLLAAASDTGAGRDSGEEATVPPLILMQSLV